MSKETIKMNSIRINRIGLKKMLCDAEWTASCNRNTISENWDKEDDAECRKALYKAHKGLSKARVVIRECQRQLKATKLEMRKLNRQYDFRLRAAKEYVADMEKNYPKTSLLG